MSGFAKSEFVEVPQKFFVRHLSKVSESEMRIYLFMRWKLGTDRNRNAPTQLTCKEISQALSMGRTQVGQTLRKLRERGLIELEFTHGQKSRIKSAYLSF